MTIAFEPSCARCVGERSPSAMADLSFPFLPGEKPFWNRPFCAVASPAQVSSFPPEKDTPKSVFLRLRKKNNDKRAGFEKLDST